MENHIFDKKDDFETMKDHFCDVTFDGDSTGRSNDVNCYCRKYDSASNMSDSNSTYSGVTPGYSELTSGTQRYEKCTWNITRKLSYQQLQQQRRKSKDQRVPSLTFACLHSQFSSSTSSLVSSCCDEESIHPKTTTTTTMKKRKSLNSKVSGKKLKTETIIKKVEKRVSGKVKQILNKYLNDLTKTLISSVTNEILSKLDSLIQDALTLQIRSEEDNETMGTIRKKLLHPDVSCNHCTKSIIGARYKCGNCVGYNLCENCEAMEGIHAQSHVFLKLHYPKTWSLSSNSSSKPLLSGLIYNSDDKNGDVVTRGEDDQNYDESATREEDPFPLDLISSSSDCLNKCNNKKRKREWKRIKKEIKKKKVVKENQKMMKKYSKKGQGFLYDDIVSNLIHESVTTNLNPSLELASLPAVTTSSPAVTTSSPAVAISSPAVAISSPAVATTSPSVTASSPVVATNLVQESIYNFSPITDSCNAQCEVTDCNVTDNIKTRNTDVVIDIEDDFASIQNSTSHVLEPSSSRRSPSFTMIDLSSDSDGVVVIPEELVPPELQCNSNAIPMQGSLYNTKLREYLSSEQYLSSSSDDIVVVPNYFDLSIPFEYNSQLYEHIDTEICQECNDDAKLEKASPETCTFAQNNTFDDQLCNQNQNRHDASHPVDTQINVDDVEDVDTEINVDLEAEGIPTADLDPQMNHQFLDITKPCITTQPLSLSIHDMGVQEPGMDENIIRREPYFDGIAVQKPAVEEDIITCEPCSGDQILVPNNRTSLNEFSSETGKTLHCSNAMQDVVTNKENTTLMEPLIVESPMERKPGKENAKPGESLSDSEKNILELGSKRIINPLTNSMSRSDLKDSQICTHDILVPIKIPSKNISKRTILGLRDRRHLDIKQKKKEKHLENNARTNTQHHGKLQGKNLEVANSIFQLQIARENSILHAWSLNPFISARADIRELLEDVCDEVAVVNTKHDLPKDGESNDIVGLEDSTVGLGWGVFKGAVTSLVDTVAQAIRTPAPEVPPSAQLFVSDVFAG